MPTPYIHLVEEGMTEAESCSENYPDGEIIGEADEKWRMVGRATPRLRSRAIVCRMPVICSRRCRSKPSGHGIRGDVQGGLSLKRYRTGWAKTR